jgi:putative transposase
VVFDLDAAYKMYFTKRKQGDEKVGQPRFKGRVHFYTQEYSQTRSSFSIENGFLKLSFGKGPKDWIEIPLRLPSRVLLGCVKTVKIGYDEISKYWFVCLSHSVEEAQSRREGHIVLFDPGCRIALTGIKTDGSFWDYDLSPLRNLNMSTYKLIDELRSRLDLMKSKTSKASRRLRKRIKKLFRKIGTRSKVYLHTLANQILKDHCDVKEFKIGDWDKRQTLADTGHAFVNRKINRAVQNNNPLQKLIEILKYKAHRLGQNVAKVDERGTTRTCSRCDNKLHEGLHPSVRNFKCPKCAFEFPRDHQSCLNLLKRYESAQWLRLPEIYSGRSRRLSLGPFSCKLQESWNELPRIFAS